MTISSYHLAHLQVIYDAYDRIYDIASHRWHDIKYYVPEFKVSNLFGHYVRSLPSYKDMDPAQITLSQYRTAAAPLAAALNEILSLILKESDDDMDIYAIIEGRSLVFRSPAAYDRAMSVFNLVEKAYPRAQYRSGRKPDQKIIEYLKPTRQATWKPYKD